MLTKMSIVESYRVNKVPEEWQGDRYIGRPTHEESERLLNAALAFTAERGKRTEDETIVRMKGNDLWTNSTFRYALAKQIAAGLNGNSIFRALYVYGDVMEDRARLTSDVDMILHVADDKANFEAWIELLDEELVKLFRSRFGLGEGVRTLLDCHVVTDEEVSRRAGYGAMLSSIHSNLTQL